MRILTLFSFLLISCSACAEGDEKSLNELARILQKGETDSVREEANRRFKIQLKSLLDRNPEPSETLPDSINSLSIQVADDKSFRIITWTIPSVKLSHYSYSGFIQRFDSKTGKSYLDELTDVSDTLSKPQGAKLKAGKWYGAVYYKIIRVKKSGKAYYTLLGWKGNNRLTSKKVVDVISFQNGVIQFGYPFFKSGKTYSQRLIFEFTAEATMSLRYDESKRLIIFDNLSVAAGKIASENNPSQFSGPDGTYNALQYKSGKWNLLKDIEVGMKVKTKKPGKLLQPPGYPTK